MDCLAIGSLPHMNPKEALDLVRDFDIPFWPQLVKLSKNEDMIFQFLENMPSFFGCEKFRFDCESERFFEQLEEFFLDYEEIVYNDNFDLLEKYAISKDFASAFVPFINLLQETKPKYGKGQIVGPFTLATTLTDNNNRCAIYDDTLKEVIIKTLCLKAIWQIKHMQKTGTKPVIFIDEPAISQLGTSAYLTVSPKDVVNMIKEIVDIIHKYGGTGAIHCCGKCDWNVPLTTGIDIISLDAYSYSENLSISHKKVEKFLQNGGKIAWGIVPTLDKTALENTTLQILTEKFELAVKYLTKRGINEKLIIDNSLISPSCGAGSLSLELATKAMRLTKELSDSLKERYNDN